jgi:hypothetical protein
METGEGSSVIVSDHEFAILRPFFVPLDLHSRRRDPQFVRAPSAFAIPIC